MINGAVWLLLLLFIAFSASLGWQEYLRVGGLAICLCYGLTTRFTDRLPAGGGQIVAVACIFFILSQFIPLSSFGEPSLPQESSSIFFSVLSLLALVAAPVAFLAMNTWKFKLNLLDGVVIAVGGFLFLLSTTLKFAFHEATTWLEEILPAGLVVIWLIRREIGAASNFGWDKFQAGVVSSFFIISLVGLLQISRVHYYSWSAARNIEESNFGAALQQYVALEGLTQTLRLESLYNESSLGQAWISHLQKSVEKAPGMISMEDTLQIVVAPDEWEGPVGGMLYKNTSCWIDLNLYAGKIQIDVFARGQPAQDIWPRMRVHLGDQILGEVDITSTETKPYRFLVENHSKQARLEIFFLNDLWQLGGLDRSLYIEQAQITYQEIEDW